MSDFSEAQTFIAENQYVKNTQLMMTKEEESNYLKVTLEDTEIDLLFDFFQTIILEYGLAVSGLKTMPDGRKLVYFRPITEKTEQVTRRVLSLE